MSKQRRFIPYGTQWISDEEISGVVSVLKGDWLSPGPQLDAFEEAVAAYCGARFAVTFSSGTAALHGALHAAGISKGDEGITSPFSWVASANCMIYQGAVPHFCDIEQESMNLSPDELRKFVTNKTKVIIPVHFAGLPCKMDEISAIAKKVGAIVVEDAAHAIGSRFQDGVIGNCEYSDMVCFSFHPVKTITTGEGGIVLTNNDNYREALIKFRNHGIVRNFEGAFPGEGPWYFDMDEIGYNYRMTNFQAAIGLAQMGRLPIFLKRRQKIRSAYDEAFQTLPALELPNVPANMSSAFHLYAIRLNLKALKVGRGQIFQDLRSRGLGVQVHYPPIHLTSYYRRNFGFQPGDFPIAEESYERIISLPIYPKMSDDEVRYVIDMVIEVIRRFQR